MKIVYYYKSTKVTVERPGDFDLHEFNELFQRVADHPETIMVEYTHKTIGTFEGTFNALINWLKLKATPFWLN